MRAILVSFLSHFQLHRPWRVSAISSTSQRNGFGHRSGGGAPIAHAAGLFFVTQLSLETRAPRVSVTQATLHIRAMFRLS
jgi:hypothetical protein